MPKALPGAPGAPGVPGAPGAPGASSGAEEQLDSGYNISACELCKEPKYTDDLDDGFCQECLASGDVQQCKNCEGKMLEDEALETDDGIMCKTCWEDLYQPHGRYSGPRRDYYSGPAEEY